MLHDRNRVSELYRVHFACDCEFTLFANTKITCSAFRNVVLFVFCVNLPSFTLFSQSVCQPKLCFSRCFFPFFLFHVRDIFKYRSIMSVTNCDKRLSLLIFVINLIWNAMNKWIAFLRMSTNARTHTYFQIYFYKIETNRNWIESIFQWAVFQPSIIIFINPRSLLFHCPSGCRRPPRRYRQNMKIYVVYCLHKYMRICPANKYWIFLW